MLQTYSWHVKLGDKLPEAVMSEMRILGAVLVRARPVLRGMRLVMTPTGLLHIQLRVAGHNRWAIQRDARKLIIMLLRRAFIHPTSLELELVTTERNGRELYAGEGRTPMTQTPRAATKSDGRPWDHYEWWGDDLPTEPSDDPGSRGGDQASVPEAVAEFPPASASRAWTSGRPPWAA